MRKTELDVHVAEEEAFSRRGGWEEDGKGSGKRRWASKEEGAVGGACARMIPKRVFFETGG